MRKTKLQWLRGQSLSKLLRDQGKALKVPGKNELAELQQKVRHQEQSQPREALSDEKRQLEAEN